MTLFLKVLFLMVVQLFAGYDASESNLNWTPVGPEGKYNVTKFDDNFEEVIAEIYDVDASEIPKNALMLTITESTNSTRNWTYTYGSHPFFCVS